MSDTHDASSRRRGRGRPGIGGMTCASCAARIEKRLNRLDGVTATVNYATEQAKVHAPGGVDRRRPDRPGRGGRLHGPAGRPVAAAGADDAVAPVDADVDETRPLRDRLIIVGRAVGAGGRAGDGPGAAVRRLAVAVADARRAGRHLGRVAVPPGGVAQPAPRHRDDGHADLGRRARRVRLVAVRAVPRRRRRARA